MNTQDRLMRTYEVRLTTPDTTPVVERVNLSYKLNEQLEPVANDGTTVDAMSITARIEVMRRLRKLAERSVTHVTTDAIDDRDWDITVVRSAFVKVPVDEAGVPVPHRKGKS